MLNIIVDNIEQCWQQNIVQACFHQARTGCPFLAVYMMTLPPGTREAFTEECDTILICPMRALEYFSASA